MTHPAQSTEAPKETPGSVDRCMGCGEKWKVGDEFISTSQAPHIIEAIRKEDGAPLTTLESIGRKERAWHPDCFR